MYAVTERCVRPNLGEKSTIIQYDIESNSWKLVSSFVYDGSRGTWGACAVAMDNYLYLIGGRSYDQDFTWTAIQTAGRFNITEKKWEKIANIQQAKWFACGVAASEKIFIAGGRIGCDGPPILATEKCEVYNSLTNEWHFIASLKRPRSRGSLVHIEGATYVVGGIPFNDSHNPSPGLVVESHNSKRDTWKPITTMPISVISLNNTHTYFNDIKAYALGVNKELLKQPITRPLKAKCRYGFYSW